MKTPEQFNPHDLAYKKVEDLPEEEQKNYENVEGGFVDKDAVKTLKEAEEEAALSRRGIGWGATSTMDRLQESAIHENFEREIIPLENKEKERGTMEEHNVLCFTAKGAGLQDTKFVRSNGGYNDKLKIFTLLKKIGTEFVPDKNKKVAFWNHSEWEIRDEFPGLNKTVKSYILYNPNNKMGFINNRSNYDYVEIFTDTLLPGKNEHGELPPEDKYARGLMSAGSTEKITDFPWPSSGSEEYLKRLKERAGNITSKNKQEIELLEKQNEEKEREKGMIDKANILYVTLSDKENDKILWHLPIHGEAKMYKTYITNDKTQEKKEIIEVEFLGKIFRFKDKGEGLNGSVETWQLTDKNWQFPQWGLYTDKPTGKKYSLDPTPAIDRQHLDESEKEYITSLLKKSKEESL